MKLITRNTDYALRAICLIAKNKKKAFSVSYLVNELGVPKPFLRKLLQVLHSKGILDSSRGNGGGFSLLKNPKEILLTDIMQIFQGSFCLNECFLSKEACPQTKDCPLRKRLSAIEDYVRKELSSVSVETLIGKGVEANAKEKDN